MKQNTEWDAGAEYEYGFITERRLTMEKEKQGKKVSKTWEAMMRLKGSLIVNDPRFLL